MINDEGEMVDLYIPRKWCAQQWRGMAACSEAWTCDCAIRETPLRCSLQTIHMCRLCLRALLYAAICTVACLIEVKAKVPNVEGGRTGAGELGRQACGAAARARCKQRSRGLHKTGIQAKIQGLAKASNG